MERQRPTVLATIATANGRITLYDDEEHTIQSRVTYCSEHGEFSSRDDKEQCIHEIEADKTDRADIPEYDIVQFADEVVKDDIMQNRVLKHLAESEPEKISETENDLSRPVHTEIPP